MKTGIQTVITIAVVHSSSNYDSKEGISNQICPSTDELIKNSGKPTPLNIICPSKEIKCCQATMRMSLENVPNERNHTVSQVGFYVYGTSWRGKSTETEGRLMVSMSLGDEKGIMTT